jgi:signal transduction histidine kinase
MGPVAAERSVRILDEVPADLPPVLVDGDRIVQVFSNLIGNAIRFTPEGGHVRLRASAEAGEVRYSVVDHGPGIPDELRPHLFSRIWQVKRRARGGMGLGLRIARGIVEAHGGRIWVESVQGQGSTFHFTVPTVTAAPEGEAPHAQGAWEADSWGWMLKEEAVEEAAVGIAVRPTLTRTARSGGAAW